jgi:hypothetical protein
LIHDSWGIQKVTAASGGHGHAAGCAVLLNVAVSDLASSRFLHINLPCRFVFPARFDFFHVGQGPGRLAAHTPTSHVERGQIADLFFLQESKG